MPASLREYRAKIRTIESTRKITRAMELIAAARVVRARQQAAAARPYSRKITQAISAAATMTHTNHPLLAEKTDDSRRAAILVVTSDRGLAGAYSANVIRTAERLIAKIHQEGREVALYCAGRKGLTYYTFRDRPVVDSWVGHSDRPTYDLACEIGDALVAQFLTENTGVDDVHLVYTRFHSMIDHELVAARMLPTEVVEGVSVPPPEELLPLYDFEPSVEAVLDALLPNYVHHRIYAVLLQAAACEQAARQRAMKAATDNADELIRLYTRIANQARQAAITQEITEIVGGANALAERDQD
ncbi:F0F1 ATP synthase subunit gamma [Nocardioides sp. CER19]|uniref:F0F1 ATP synthase subunit gamma n=1 Tax=Nocardioides sp. CER19 TaxID=3038538 RepID=UPI002449872E|nr:F0F1 ATP synthase subunit gamma [Nocardioides sp. CER19]MDH2414576.1 F0F1 ATP synthase subunit gamma [Nocardioides sp. CER19]